MLEVAIDTLGIDADSPSQEAVDAGAPPMVQCHVVGGQQLPFSQQGSQEPIKIPSVVLKFALTKDAALQYADLIKEKAEQLPDEQHSSILTANSMADVGRMAQNDQHLRGN